MKSLSCSTASAMRFIVSTASTGYSPAAEFGRKHDRVGALEDGGRDVRHLRARRHRRGDHALQHLRRHHRRLAEPARGARNPLLHAGHRLERHLHAEIAARDHDGVGELHDLVELLQRLRLLDLGHDAGAALHDLARFGDVVRTLDEGERHPVDFGGEHCVEIAPVLVGQRARAKHRVGQADALAVGELPALLDLGHGAALLDLLDRQAHAPVVRGGWRGPARGLPGSRGAGAARARDCRDVRRCRARRSGPSAARRTRPRTCRCGVSGPAGRQECRSGGRASSSISRMAADERPHRFVRGMAHVDAKNVGAGLEELVDGFRSVGGWSEGSEDLDLSPASHRPPTPRLVGSVSWIVQLS